MRLTFPVKLVFAGTLMAGLLATTPAAFAQPLAVSNAEAQLISYFKSYTPAAEVLVNKNEKNEKSVANQNTVTAKDAATRTSRSELSPGNKEDCKGTTQNMIEASASDNKTPSTPQLQ